jgi:SAM-dependent methyltransferase
LRVLGDKFDSRPGVREQYERKVATSGRILDIGGRNKESRSAARLCSLGATPENIVCTDILPHYCPDLVDDITHTSIAPGSFDGVYCDAILEHTTEYWAAIDNIRVILKPGGQAFIYVPFIYRFHDQMDFHRFTITEVARMVDDFAEVRVFMPGLGGYGWVLSHILSFGQLEQWFPRMNRVFVKTINAMLGVAARVVYRLRPGPYTADQFVSSIVEMQFNHGFCAWVRK